MSVYTKKGDKGKTSAIKWKCISKNELLFWAIGSLDELNSWIGVISPTSPKATRGFLIEIQRNLFLINSVLAGADLKFPGGRTKKLEKEIDRLENKLPKLANFILPGGTPLAAKFHYGRVLTRRAERYLVALNEERKVNPEILKYVNRLSDLMFTFAREANFNSGVKEMLQ